MSLGSTLAVNESPRARRSVPPRGGTHRRYIGRLTPRLAQVRDLIVAGLQDKEIAQTLGLTLKSVKTYAHEVFKVTGKRRHQLRAPGLFESAADGLPRMGAFE